MRRRTTRATAARAWLGAFVVVATGATGCAGGARPGAGARARVTTTTTATSPTAATASPTTTTATTTTTTTTSTGTAAASPASRCPGPTTRLTSGRHTLTSGGEEREYLLDLPAHFDPASPTPVILSFHGSGSNMAEQEAYSRFNTEGTARGYLVVTPNGTGAPRGWQLGGGRDDVFVGDLLAAIGAGACIDGRRIFATGISNGSAFSALMACREPYRIAAVGMVAATVPSLCPTDRPIAAVAFHGTADPIVPYGGGRVAADDAGATRAPGAEGAIAQWAERNRCHQPPRETSRAADVLERSWTGCDDGEDVTFYRVDGGGHTWPGGIDVSKLGITHLGATTQSISATTVFLDFFDAHPLPADRSPSR